MNHEFSEDFIGIFMREHFWCIGRPRYMELLSALDPKRPTNRSFQSDYRFLRETRSHKEVEALLTLFHK